MKISQSVLAALGGACQQAVSQSGNPRRWLDCRLTWELLSPGLDNRTVDILNRIELFEASLAKRIGALPFPKIAVGNKGERREGRGRPTKRDPEELALFLESPFVPGDTLQSVFVRYSRFYAQRVLEVVKNQQGLSGEELTFLLHEKGIPIYVNSDPCKE